MNHCSACGSSVTRGIPTGDNRERDICTQCGLIHYQNPTLVAGCIPQWEGKILLCRRAIEPRRTYWTLPAGFHELGETLPAAAAREALEEACARVEIDQLFAVCDVVHAGQVHVMYTAHMIDGQFGVGEESLATELFDRKDIPWRDLAFPSVRFTLERFVAGPATPNGGVHTVALGNDAGHDLAGWPNGGN